MRKRGKGREEVEEEQRKEEKREGDRPGSQGKVHCVVAQDTPVASPRYSQRYG